MKWIYVNSIDNSSRYVLGTVGNKPLVCFGINPSTAEPDNLDRTLESVDRLAKSNGFDSWIMLNVYPQRSTDPNLLHRSLDKELHIRNLNEIESILKEYKPVIWASWGTLIEKRKYLYSCLKDIVELTKKYDCNWISIGKISKYGHPHHPLYLKSTEQSKVFLIDDYLDKSQSL